MTEPKPSAATPPPRRRAATEKALRRRNRREQHAAKRTARSADTEPSPDQSTGSASRERRTAKASRRTDSSRTDAEPTDTRSSRGSRDRRTNAGTRRERRQPGRRKRRPDRKDRSTNPSHRRVLTRRWVALGVLLSGVGAVVALLFTPLLGVRNVTVSGLEGLTAEQVRSRAAIPLGTPMLRLDGAGIMVRVATLPRVATVDVSRDWPNTVHIAVIERHPVGVVNRPDGVHLVDATGLDYATVRAAPVGLPTLQLPHIAPNDPLTHAVMAVLAVLPAQLKSQVVSVSAPTPGGVTLVLASGKTVRWGGTNDPARKSAVLAALLTQPGKLYDVSSPDLPTISS